MPKWISVTSEDSLPSGCRWLVETISGRARFSRSQPANATHPIKAIVKVPVFMMNSRNNRPLTWGLVNSRRLPGRAPVSGQSVAAALGRFRFPLAQPYLAVLGFQENLGTASVDLATKHSNFARRFHRKERRKIRFRAAIPCACVDQE